MYYYGYEVHVVVVCIYVYQSSEDILYNVYNWI